MSSSVQSKTAAVPDDCPFELGRGREVSDRVVRWVRDVGFPIAVAAFLLWRVDQRLEQMAVSLVRHDERLAELVRSVVACDRGVAPGPSGAVALGGAGSR